MSGSGLKPKLPQLGCSIPPKAEGLDLLRKLPRNQDPLIKNLEKRKCAF